MSSQQQTVISPLKYHDLSSKAEEYAQERDAWRARYQKGLKTSQELMNGMTNSRARMASAVEDLERQLARIRGWQQPGNDLPESSVARGKCRRIKSSVDRRSPFSRLEINNLTALRFPATQENSGSQSTHDIRSTNH